MDDYSMTSLNESKNEWCARLVNTLSPTIVQGLKSIFDEAWNLCITNDEEDKYLMTFQTFLSRVPKWNQTIIESERARITEMSGCSYLEELITCVHIIQLKSLSCVRVGQKQKKIDIDIPSVDMFIHKVYINVARKVYTNIYLFETILRAYMSETEEKEIVVSEVVEVLPPPPPTPTKEKTLVEDVSASASSASASSASASSASSASASASSAVKDTDKSKSDTDTKPAMVITKAEDPIPFTPAMAMNISTTRLSFDDTDNAVDTAGTQYKIEAPKTIERLEQISSESHRRMLAEAAQEDDDDGNERLSIGDTIKLNVSDINDIGHHLNFNSLNPPILEGIETLY